MITASEPMSQIRYLNYLGFLAIACMFLGLGGWAAWASINGAVIASSTVIVANNSKKIQHVDGGNVTHINVKDGQYVTVGEVLVRLDKTEHMSNLGVINTKLDELRAKLARLIAERDRKLRIVFPEDLQQREKNINMLKILQGQVNLKNARLAANESRKQQLRQRANQLAYVIKGEVALQKSKEKQIELIRQELKVLNLLQNKKLVPVRRVLAMEREQARLEGELEKHISSIARAKEQIGENNLRIQIISQTDHIEVLKEIQLARVKISELREKRIAIREKLRRTEIRSPISGTVHQLNVHTIGGVITSGEPIMLIVPKQKEDVFEAQINPQDIDRIQIGQKALVRLTAFDKGTTPMLNGAVMHISADLTRSRENQHSYYVVRVRLFGKELNRIGDPALKPGMPAEIFIQTGSRTAFSYLIKPLSDQITRAFRER